jgi:hypothetical protein
VCRRVHGVPTSQNNDRRGLQAPQIRLVAQRGGLIPRKLSNPSFIDELVEGEAHPLDIPPVRADDYDRRTSSEGIDGQGRDFF